MPGPLSCPNCSNSYCTKACDNPRQYVNSRYPLLLECGHFTCEGCLHSAAKLQKYLRCLICNVQTVLPDGDESVKQLVASSYMLTQIANTKKPAFNVNYRNPVGMRKPNQQKNALASGLDNTPFSSSIPVCDECSRHKAVWKCIPCSSNYCGVCFDKVHKSSRTLKKHKNVPLNEEESHSYIETDCKDHGRTLDIYCEDDDELVCSYCVVMGKHKGHDVVYLSDKNEENMEKLRDSVVSGVRVWNRLKQANEKIDLLANETRRNQQQMRNAIQTEFLRLHGLLERREQCVINELEKYCAEEIAEIETIQNEAVNNVKTVLALITDANKVLVGKQVSVNVFLLLKKLVSSQQLPIFFHSSPESESLPKIELSFSPSLLQAVDNFGEVKYEQGNKYSLLKAEELPSNFVIEEIPEESLLPNNGDDTDSVHSSSFASTDGYSVSSMAKPDVQHSSGKSSVTSLQPVILNFNQPDHIQYFTNEQVQVTHVRSPGYFMIRRATDSKKLQALSEQINKYAKNKDHKNNIPTTVTVGEIYIGRYSEDKEWYRAKVKAVITDDKGVEVKVEVVYIDYGNCETINMSNMKRILEPKLLMSAPMAWPCKLFDIVPVDSDKWSADAIKMLFRLTANKVLNMKVMDNADGTLIVDLLQRPCTDIRNDTTSSIRDALVFLGVAKFASNPSQSETSETFKRTLLQETVPSRKTSQIVALCHVESVLNFFVQKQGAKSKQLSEMMANMQKKYSSKTTTSLNVMCPTKGMACAAKFSADNVWYRAEIMSNAVDFTVTVKYVDYGNTEDVQSVNLRKLADAYLVLPAQAVECALADVAPVDLDAGWTREAVQFFVNIAGNKKLKMKVNDIEDGVVYVTLFLINIDVNINVNALMVKEGYAISTGESSQRVGLADIKIPTNTLQIKSGDQGESSASTKNEEFDSPELSFTPSSRVKNRKMQNLRKKELRNAMFPCTTPPDSRVVPLEPEHGSTVETDGKQVKKKKSEYIPLNITHVESPSVLFFKLKSDPTVATEDRLQQLMNEMQTEYNHVSDTGNVTWEEKTACAVYNPEDNLWYRAIVKKIIEEEDNVEVFCVDYGQSLCVSKQNINILLEQFQVQPAFCSKCHLTGIRVAGDGNKWSNSACEYLSELIENNDEQLFFIHNKTSGKIEGSVAIDLFVKETSIGGALEPSRTTFINVAKKLVDQGLALPTMNCVKVDDKNQVETSIVQSESEELASPTSSVMSLEMTSPVVHVGLTWKPALLPRQTKFQCKPTYVSDDCGIYLHDTDTAEQNQRIISDALQMKFKDTQPLPHDLYWLPGQPCAAKFHLDQKWYRAEIIEVKVSSVKVKFVDYGNIEQIDHQDLRKDVIMTDMPIQSVVCDLFGVKPMSTDGSWSLNVLDFVHKSIVDKLCHVTINVLPKEMGMRPKVDLTILPDINVKTLLIDARCAEEIEENDVIVEEEEEVESVKDILLEFSSGDIPFPSAYLPETDEILPVVITQMLTPNQVSLQKLVSCDETPSKVQETINEQYHKFLDIMREMHENAIGWPKVTNPNKGMTCCGQYTHDDTWYRAEILNAVGDDSFLVRYIDYGNCEVLNVDRLRLIPKHLVEFPIQAISCTLHQVTYHGDDHYAETSAKMMNIFFNSENSFYAKIKSAEPEVKVDLLTKDEDGNFKLSYQSLIDNGDIALIRDKQPQEIL